MTKTRAPFFILITLVFIHLIVNDCFSQAKLVLDGNYIVLNGGTTATPIYLVVNESSTNAITRLGGGHIISENQYNFIKWNVGITSGNYVFPFGVGGTPTDYIPFTFNKTAGNSSVSISTWFTSPQNLPQPAATNVGPVTNMTGITDSVIYAIDRFWNIQAPTTTADLTFSYRGIENTTANPTANVRAQHWNGTAWDIPVLFGNPGDTAGIGTAGPFVGQTTFSPWVLTVCQTDTLTQNISICQGDSIVIGANTYNVSGTFIDTLMNISGCDSVITTNLTVNPIATSNANVSICQGDSILLGGSFQTVAGNYIDTIFGGSSLGCDSVITTTLTVNPIATSNANVSICQGDSILLGGNFQTVAGNYIDTIFGGSSLGCDSVITTNLTVNPIATSNANVSICQGDSILLGGSFQTVAGNYIDTIFGGSSLGCDSVITTTLVVLPVLTTSLSFTECQGFSITVGTNTYSTSGTFNDTLTAINGCDSIITTNLTITPSNNVNQVFVECGGFSITVGSNTYTTTGTFIDVFGCDTTFTDLTINPAPQLSVITTNDNCGDSIGSAEVLGITSNPPLTYNWSTGSTDSIITNLIGGTYSVLVSDNLGCSSTINAIIEATNLNCPFFVYVPNVFTPNGDGNNDMFFVEGKGIQNMNIKIYNRWGNKVFESDKINEGWDGKYKGSEQNTAVFVYVLDVTFENGKTVTESGNVSIIR